MSKSNDMFPFFCCVLYFSFLFLAAMYGWNETSSRIINECKTFGHTKIHNIEITCSVSKN